MLGFLSFVFTVFTIVAFFHIRRIRNEAIETNKHLSMIVKAMGAGSIELPTHKMCRCGARNRWEDNVCISCGKPLI
jgi:hypothetical protein